MHNTIIKFLKANQCLPDIQYGFWSGRSCEHALLKAQETLLDSLNRRHVSLILLIDFSKAFDMVDHSILLDKLEHCGIRGSALKCMASYLNNSKQFVRINSSDSSTKNMTHDVPQTLSLRGLT